MAVIVAVNANLVGINHLVIILNGDFLRDTRVTHKFICKPKVSSLLRRKLSYPLFLTPSADEDLAVLFANDVAVEALKDDFAGVFGVDDAVAAFEKFDVSHGSVAIGVLGELVVQ